MRMKPLCRRLRRPQIGFVIMLLGVCAGAPTAFGPVDLTVTAASDRLTISLPSAFRTVPERLWVRVPWFFAVERAELDGETVSLPDGPLLLPPGARELVLHGAMRPDTPPLSYAQTVADYQAEYRRRWQHFRRTGERLPSEPDPRL